MSTSVLDQFRYDMNHRTRGLFLIVNNKNFKRGGVYNKRVGSEVDTEEAIKLFESLAFTVRVKKDLKRDDMMGLMEEAASMNHSDADCVGALIMSHGEEGVICGTDANISIEDLLSPFKNCPSLIGKPKIFFFQACRGEKDDIGSVAAMTDSARRSGYIPDIPLETDFLYSYSTAPGYVAWRDPDLGSPYVQALCNELSSLAATDDVVSILTHVNYTVAYNYSTGPVGDGDDRYSYKQQPSIVSMLSKKLFLKPK